MELIDQIMVEMLYITVAKSLVLGVGIVVSAAVIITKFTGKD